MVERRTPERGGGASILTQVLVIPRKRWLRPDITEKLFTGTLSKNETKTKGTWNPITFI